MGVGWAEGWELACEGQVQGTCSHLHNSAGRLDRQACKPRSLGGGGGGQHRNQEGVLEARVPNDRAGAQRMRHMQLAAYPFS